MTWRDARRNAKISTGTHEQGSGDHGGASFCRVGIFLGRTRKMTSFSATIVAGIVTNLVVTNVVVHVLGHKSKSLRDYYTELNALALVLDVSSIVWGTLLSQRVAGHSCGDQIMAAVAIQVVHDIVFGMILQKTNVNSRTMSLFRSYAREHGAGILSVDAVMMVVSVVLSRALAWWQHADTVLLGTIALYTHVLLLDLL
jgi:hypothetical protein